MNTAFDLSPFTIGLFGLIMLVTIKFSTAYHEKYKLKHIPTVGPDGILSSYVTVWKWIAESTKVVEEGYRLYPGRIFKIPSVDGWLIVLSSTKHVDDLRKASSEQLSSPDAVADILKIAYTIHPKIEINPYHVDVTRHPLTRNISVKFGELQDELDVVIPEKIPLSDDWIEIHPWPAILQIIARSTNRFLLGPAICRDPDFSDLIINFALNVFKGARRINLFPKIFHPIVGRIFTGRRVALRRVRKLLKPIIEERLRMREEYGEDWEDKPNDYIQWLIDAEQFAPPAQRSSMEDLCARVLAINFGAIHTTSGAILTVLYRLASNPDVVEPLRNEIESAIRKEGTTKEAVAHTRLLDSFVKESARLNPGSSTAVGVRRKALKDFKFSDGTIVPAGSTIAVANWSILRDEEIYPGGAEFRPFRFAEMREEDGESTNHHFATVKPDWMFFGQGRHA
ncbi:cytochrome P450 [Dendrothele bispora CBS 962.96]|uniref:Cytochrome P450 n=1 Tax=Dendrothele bispora (strain CBS 962.96) TaxID=1314807 RepID=A0A4S8M996_DENBC|nr:cytochrome P450 [Dendrothele bispora CBS 962.96]